MSIKQEDFSKTPAQVFSTLVKDVVYSHKDLWYLDDRIPSLGEVRFGFLLFVFYCPTILPDVLAWLIAFPRTPFVGIYAPLILPCLQPLLFSPIHNSNRVLTSHITLIFLFLFPYFFRVNKGAGEDCVI